MKHIEILKLICKYKELIDRAYKEKRVFSIPYELYEIGLFNKIGEYYYLNESYKNFVDTLLSRADYSYIAQDFEKEIKRLANLIEDYKTKKDNFTKDLIFEIVKNIFDGMKNRDKRVLALIEKLEGDKISDLEILIKEAKKILSDIEDVIVKNKEITALFIELKNFEEFKELIKDVLIEVVELNKNIDLYLKRLREFISQTEKKRAFNQKLFAIAYMILNEDIEIDKFLQTKSFAYKNRVLPLADLAYINENAVKKVLDIKIKKEKSCKIKKEEEIIELIDLKKLLEFIRGSEDIFKSIIKYIGNVDRELLNESVRVFVYILNHFDKELIYTKKFNEFNVRVVKWKK